MDWQFVLVMVVVTLSAAYLLRRMVTTLFARKGSCGGGCGCHAPVAKDSQTTSPVTIIPVDQLRVRSQNRGTE
jgi:hypothetical protein